MLGLCRSVLSMTMLNARMKAVSGFGKTDPFWIVIVAVTATTIIIAVITTTTTTTTTVIIISSSIVVITTITTTTIIIVIMIMMIMMTISSSSSSSRARWRKSPAHTHNNVSAAKGKEEGSKGAKEQRKETGLSENRNETSLLLPLTQDRMETACRIRTQHARDGKSPLCLAASRRTNLIQ